MTAKTSPDAALSGLSLPGRDAAIHAIAVAMRAASGEMPLDQLAPSQRIAIYRAAGAAYDAMRALSPPISGDAAKALFEAGFHAAERGLGFEGCDESADALEIEWAEYALSLPADGWQTIDSAPKDGRQLTLIDMSAAAPEAGSGYFWDGVWSCVEPNSQVPASAICWQSPTHWRNPAAPPITPKRADDCPMCGVPIDPDTAICPKCKDVVR